jgi:hypothetical protein
MACLKSVKRTKIFSEFTPEENEKYFGLTREKFLHNIDSLYYVVKVKNDWNNDSGCISLVEYLEKQKEVAIKSFEPIVLFQNHKKLNELGSGFIMNGKGFSVFSYDIEKTDKYVMFVAKYAVTSKTPEIWIQIKAQNLWLQGEHQCIRESLSDLEALLNKFNIEIEEVRENRIDYAYHTNYIQDPLNFFKEKDLNRMQQSRFSRWSKEGKFIGEYEVESDYVTLGRKKSNNLFFRAYNKTKEVVEQGYKQFFIKLWYMEKLINYFDLYCLEKAFKKGRWDYLDIARLEFYLEFGQDDATKKEIVELINEKKSRDYEKIREYAKKLVPAVTTIVNIEIETKRKFYYSMDKSIENLLQVTSKNVPDYARKLFSMIDNKQVFHNYITCNQEDNDGIIRFLDYKKKNKNGEAWTRKSKFPTASWWKKLQNVNIYHKSKSENVRLLREYQKSVSKDLLKTKIVNSVSTYKLYLDHEDESNVKSDVIDFLSTLNENDIKKAMEYKQKKFAQIKSRLTKLDKTDGKRIYKLVNIETGEIID